MTESGIFKIAVKLPPNERGAYLDQACGANEALRLEMEGLLGAHDQAGEFMQRPPIADATTTTGPGPERPGMRIGPYKLLQFLGEGGMGTVFLAEQTEPVRRMVALKIIKPGMDSSQVLARFEAERQALALMDHPNIARVLDAGTVGSEQWAGTVGSEQWAVGRTEGLSSLPTAHCPLPTAARPYFVMELVKGIPITEFCDTNKLNTRQRLELFIPVCQAIQHAHMKGIIHRDVKPSNVLIALYDGKPVPKVIDFGVAKAMAEPLTKRTLFTQVGQIVGTFEYMSPEQATLNQLDIDTRSDVYSLGVLLYELLTGVTPLDKDRLRSLALDQMLRTIREEEPMRPSVRLSSEAGALATAAAYRGTEATRLAGVLRGELDWIVMKCLEKERDRRFITAGSLAQDVERYLRDEPVTACPPTVGYRLRKFVRKHRRLLATAAAFAVLLLLGVAVSAWQAVRATQAEAVANENAVQAQDKEQEAKKERDEVKALNDKLRNAEARLRNTLYLAHMSLAQHAWDAGNVERVEQLLEQLRPGPRETDLRSFEWHYFQKLCHPELLLTKIQGYAMSLAYSPDGKSLAAATMAEGPAVGATYKPASGLPGVTVLDPRTGKVLHSLKVGSSQTAGSASLSPDGKLLATSAKSQNRFGSGAFSVWDAQIGKLLHTLKTPEAIDARLPQLKVAFSPDGKHLATFNQQFSQSVVRIWDVKTGQELRALKGIFGLPSFSPDGKRLASSYGGGGVKVFDAESGQELLSTEKLGTFGVTSSRVVFSPDGKMMAAARAPQGANPPFPPEINVWDATTGDKRLTLTGHTEEIHSLAFSPDGLRLASASADRTVKIWDAKIGKELLTLKGHTQSVIDLAFRPDGKHLATVGEDGTVRVWDLQPPGFQGIGKLADMAISPDGKRVATAAYTDKGQRDLKVWDAQTGRELIALKGLVFVGTGMAARVVFSPDGKRLAGATTRMTKVWNVETGEELVSFEKKGIGAGAAFSPDGKTLALAGVVQVAVPPAFVTLWDAQTAKEFFSFQVPDSQFVQPIGFSPDGKRLFGWCKSSDLAARTAKVWDAQSGQELFSIKLASWIPGQGNWVSVLTVSPDGKRLAGVSPDNTVKVWDAQTGAELLAMKGGHRKPVTSIGFSPDGQRLVSACSGETETVKVWHAQTGETLMTLQGQGPVAFSPDGHRLFGRAADGTVKIWNATPPPEKLKE